MVTNGTPFWGLNSKFVLPVEFTLLKVLIRYLYYIYQWTKFDENIPLGRNNFFLEESHAAP